MGQDVAAGPDRLTFELPEPPTINVMLRLHGQYQRRGKKRIPLYQIERRNYQLQCEAAARDQGITPPPAPWLEWQVLQAAFRVWSPKDPIELLASLKWAIDFLVRAGYVRDDSARQLAYIPSYFGLVEPTEHLSGITQWIDRSNRGVRLMVGRLL